MGEIEDYYDGASSVDEPRVDELLFVRTYNKDAGMSEPIKGTLAYDLVESRKNENISC